MHKKFENLEDKFERISEKVEWKTDLGRKEKRKENNIRE